MSDDTPMQSIPDLGRSLELDSADAEYIKALKNDPSLVDAWRMRFRIALERGRKQDAIKLLMQGIELNPEQSVLVADLVNLHLQSRDAAAARPLVEQLMRSDAEKPEYIFSKARLSWMEGDYEEALGLFKRAAGLRPAEVRFAMSHIQSLVSLDRIPEANAELERWQAEGASGEMFVLSALCRYDAEGLDAALKVITDGLTRFTDHGYLYYLQAVLLTLAGEDAKAQAIAQFLPQDPHLAVRWRGFLFARKQGGSVPFCGLESTLLTKALAAAPAAGAVLEFGVYQGLSLGNLARRITTPIHGFDSFEGLPEDWKPGELKGSYSTGGRVPSLPAHVKLHRGWFEDALPKFVASQKEKLRFVHVDCDLYSSTLTVLDGLRPLLQPGTVFLFDEFLGFEGFEQHEFRAWHEFAERHKIRYEYTAFTLMAKQVALRVTAL